MLKKKPGKTTSHSKPSTDSGTLDEGAVNQRYKTYVEEKEYSTIPGSTLATSIALSHSRAQANATIEQGPSCKTKIKKLSKGKAKGKSTQTPQKNKDSK